LENRFILLFCSFFVFLYSCNFSEEVITRDKGAKLIFSQDSIIFDTIFTSKGSITRRVKVYNPSSNAIIIDKISLGQGNKSSFKVLVNGIQSSDFSNLRLLGNDSLLILISVHIDPRDENLPFIIQDSLSFLTNSNLQEIKLLAWGQDAHFLRKSVLDGEHIWDGSRPYVILDTILVNFNSSLTIKKGARVFMNRGTNLFVLGSLKIEGEPEERVVFRNPRFEPRFDVPGQWGSIYFLEGSKDNIINYAYLKNGTIALRLGTPDNDTIPDLIVSNTILENMSVAGVLAFNSDLYMYNTLINQCGIGLGNLAGGNYTYDHCTITNFSSSTFYREDPLVIFTNILPLDNISVLINDLNVNLKNTIIWGNFQDEILLNQSKDAGFTIYDRNNLLKSRIDFFIGNNNIINQNPLFVDPSKRDFNLKIGSPAINKAFPGRQYDINGARRGTTPDIGAFEHIE
jgi:hypothetical protein